MKATCLPFSVTKPARPNFGDYVAIFFGFTPVVLPLLLIAAALYLRTKRLLFYSTFPIVCAVYVLLIKAVIEEDRPAGSACYDKGMPSSHAAIAIGLTVMLALDCAFNDRHPLKYKVPLMTAALLLLLPVPYSRVWLKDHSMSQVTVGVLVGIVLGSLWFWLMTGKGPHPTKDVDVV